jgi:DNA adenine methylase
VKETVFCDEIKELLEHSTIECDDAFKIIKRYDCSNAWFFIDPPYVGSNMGHYANMFNEQNLVELLDICINLKGKFMLTMYPNDIIKEYASKYGWVIYSVDRQVSACKVGSRRRQEEWMVCNYKESA